MSQQYFGPVLKTPRGGCKINFKSYNAGSASGLDVVQHVGYYDYACDQYFNESGQSIPDVFQWSIFEGVTQCPVDATKDEKLSPNTGPSSSAKPPASLDDLVQAMTAQTAAFQQLANAIGMLAQAIMEQQEEEDVEARGFYLDGSPMAPKEKQR